MSLHCHRKEFVDGCHMWNRNYPPLRSTLQFTPVLGRPKWKKLAKHKQYRRVAQGCPIYGITEAKSHAMKQIPKSQSIFPDKIIQDRRKQHTITKKNIYTIVVDLYSLQSFLFLFKFHIKNLQNPRLNQTNHMVLRMNRK